MWANKIPWSRVTAVKAAERDLAAAFARWCRFFDRRPRAAYGIAVLAVGVSLALDGAVAAVAPGPALMLCPAIIAATLLGGPGPGVVALLTGLTGAWLFPWPSAQGDVLVSSSGVAVVYRGLLATLGGALVALGAALRKELIRLLGDEERLRLAIRATGLGTWNLDGTTGVRHWSSEFRAIIGLDALTPADPELLATLIHPDDRDRVDERFQAAHSPDSDGWYEAEFRIHRADNGEERWVAAKGRMVLDAGGRLLGAAGTIVDITARQATEAALRESEQRYRTLIETAPDAVNVQRDGVIIVANQQAIRLFGGRVPEDIIGRTAISLVDASSVALARERTIRITATGLPNPLVEMTMRRLDGSTVPVEAASAAVSLEGRPAILAVLRDITKRKRSEAALRESEARFRLAAAAVQGIVYDLDLRTGIAWRSDGLKSVLGVTPDDVSATRDWWLQRIHPGDAPRLAEDGHLLDDPDLSHIDREYRVRHAEGHWVHVHDRSFVVRDEAGQALRVVGVVTDVSERKAVEVQQALLMREVDHRARNALSVVQSLVRLTRAAEPYEFKQAVEARVAALARVHSLLAGNRWRGTDLRKVVEEELAVFPDGVVMVTGPAVHLCAEAAQPMAMVLHELATNAVKHGALSRTGGRLDMSWRLDSDGGLQVRWDETGGPEIREAPEQLGFGSTLIETMVRAQLGGHVEHVWRKEGLLCEFAVAPDRLS